MWLTQIKDFARDYTSFESTLVTNRPVSGYRAQLQNVEVDISQRQVLRMRVDLENNRCIPTPDLIEIRVNIFDLYNIVESIFVVFSCVVSSLYSCFQGTPPDAWSKMFVLSKYIVAFHSQIIKPSLCI